jgi:hypothetical protein
MVGGDPAAEEAEKTTHGDILTLGRWRKLR